MTTCAEYAAMLAEAIAARHQVTLGNRVKLMRFGEKSFEYSAVNLRDLQTYIADLQAHVDDCNGFSTRRRITRFIAEDSDS